MAASHVGVAASRVSTDESDEQGQQQAEEKDLGHKQAQPAKKQDQQKDYEQ